MKVDRYELRAESSLTIFEFVSRGPKGQITKLVQYSETIFPNLYNLGFGDKDQTSGKIDDKVVTNNGDSHKVLATVAATLCLSGQTS